MKTHRIDIHKFKAASNSGHGEILFRVDAQITATPPRSEDDSPSTTLVMDEATARVLMVLLKTQLAAFDGRKARSQR